MLQEGVVFPHGMTIIEGDTQPCTLYINVIVPQIYLTKVCGQMYMDKCVGQMYMDKCI